MVAVAGEHDLTRLLRGMRPHLRPGRYVFATVRGEPPRGVTPVVTVAEDEGSTLVVPREQADAAGLAYDYVAAWITLRVHSALGAVGLTAAVATELARAGVSCNVVAGYHHDHLFVPHERATEAVAALERLAAEAEATGDGTAGDEAAGGGRSSTRSSTGAGPTAGGIPDRGQDRLVDHRREVLVAGRCPGVDQALGDEGLADVGHDRGE